MMLFRSLTIVGLAWLVAGCSAFQPPETLVFEAKDPTALPPMLDDRFRDCTVCPEMLWLPAGEGHVGHPRHDRGEYRSGPPVRVTLAAFAIARLEVTRDQFAAFVEETGYLTEAERNIPVDERALRGCSALYRGHFFRYQDRASWREPLFESGPDYPVVCVSWNDANAYAQWLTRHTGQKYRLPTQSEWEYAARAGTAEIFPWAGNACRFENLGDRALKRKYGLLSTLGCDDRAMYLAPAGSYRATGWGLHDMVGNVREWVQDCWTDDYTNLPTDGTPMLAESCSRRVIRGASWGSDPRWIDVTARTGSPPAARNVWTGFRVVRE